MRNVISVGGVVLALAALASACGGGDTGDEGFTGGTSGTGATGGSGGNTGGSGGTGATGGLGATGGGGGTGGSGATGGTGGVAGSGTGATGGTGGTGGNTCTDPGVEPNDSVVLAVPVCSTPPCEISECDSSGSTGYGGPMASIQGVTGPGDPDNFKFDGKDTVGLCSVDAGAKTVDAGFRLCVLVTCKMGSTSPTSCSGTTETIDGLNACCVQAPGEIEYVFDCTGSVTDDDSATVVVRTDSANACAPYTVDFHF